MGLANLYYVPFDRTYADVTRRIEREADKLDAPDSDWLRRLVVTFQEERNLWNDRPELTDYRARWFFLRSRILRLVAGAYLHIGYDLPRAIANDWPGTSNWNSGPDEAKGREIYFRLRKIFPESLVKSSRSFRTVGITAVALWLPSRNALSAAAVWVDNLRQAAWIHADILSTAPDRHLREMAMAKALTAAIEDASLVRPWSIFHLEPPHDAFFTPVWVGLATILLPLMDRLTGAIGLIIISSFLTAGFLRRRAELRRDAYFVYVWGYLLNDYLPAAVNEPEGFDSYRGRRRAELGIAPGRGAALL